MKAVLIGASGYGDYFYLDRLEHEIPDGLGKLCAVVDPFIRNAPRRPFLEAHYIPVYDSLESFYEQDRADLVIIASPVPFHKEQVLCALSHGAVVLCEKPLVPVLQEADELEAALKASGGLETPCRSSGAPEWNSRLLVGFQWSYAPAILQLKEDILAGRLGRPISLKTCVSWRRPDAYYQGSFWKGRIRDDAGRWVLDSILSNATAHYLHNMLFLSGSSMDTAALPESVEGSLYRAREIETYDTAFLRGQFAGGAQFYIAVSHSAEQEANPRLEYTFENAVVSLDTGTDGILRAQWKDGTCREYGEINSKTGGNEKILAAFAAAQGTDIGRRPTCGIRTIRPHLAVCNAVLDHIPVTEIPESFRMRVQEPQMTQVRGLYEALEQGYRKMLLPDELGCPWAAPSVRFSLEGYDHFEGRLFT